MFGVLSVKMSSGRPHQPTGGAPGEDGCQQLIASVRQWLNHNTILLECWNGTWADRSDKIPRQMLSYLLGDLCPFVKLGATLQDHRFIFCLDPHRFPTMDAVESKLFCGKHTVTAMGFTCDYLYSAAEPDSTHVDILTRIWTRQSNESIIQDDICYEHQIPVRPHPELHYLPSTYVTSTPKKKNPAPDEVSRMNRGEMEMLIKKLLKMHTGQAGAIASPAFDDSFVSRIMPDQEAPQGAVGPTPSAAAQPPKDPPANLEKGDDLLLQHSQVIAKAFSDQGLIKSRMPKLDAFSGEKGSNKISFSVWEKQVLALADQYPDDIMLQTIRASLKGLALEVACTLPASATWPEIIEALKVKFQVRGSHHSLMSSFFNTWMEPGEDVAHFATRIEQRLTEVESQFPKHIKGLYWDYLKDRLFHGSTEYMKTNLRPTYILGPTYFELLDEARRIESESRDPGKAKGDSNPKGKGKVAAVSMDPAVKQLEASYQSTNQKLAKFQQNLNEIRDALKQRDNPQPSPQQPQPTAQPPAQPQTQPQTQPNGNPHRGRGDFRGRGRGRGRGTPARELQCYFCVGKVPPHLARHRMADCEYVKQARSTFFDDTEAAVPAGPQPPQGNQ